LDVKAEELAVLEKQSGNPDLWSDAAKAQALLKRAASIRDLIANWEGVSKQCDDLGELYELSKNENDNELVASIEKDVSVLDAKISEMELRKMLNGTDDAAPALFSINSGAGGTESQDWTQMLLRMYTMYFEKENIPFKVLDIQEGDTAGIKGCTL
jgi:peptide chain release factor 2